MKQKYFFDNNFSDLYKLRIWTFIAFQRSDLDMDDKNFFIELSLIYLRKKAKKYKFKNNNGSFFIKLFEKILVYLELLQLKHNN